MTEQLLSGLNDNQKEAVQTIDGPVLIIAGPGSGKTRVITHRIAYMLKHEDISPFNILAVTFTNKAANEMKSRLAVLVGDESRNIAMGTFHSICSRILRVSGGKIGIESDFVIYNNDDQIALVKRCMASQNIDPKRFAPQAILAAISSAKSNMISPDQFSYMAHDYFGEVVDRIYKPYQESLRTMNALDFDDLLLETVRLFKESADTLNYYQQKYRYVMVDEFQDTNITQYELVKLLASSHKNLCVVGDPDQSIYSWRAADIRNILNFEKDFKNCQIIELGQNYRSTKTILHVASNVIKHNRDRKKITLSTDNDKGDPVVVAELFDDREEANFVVRNIDEMVRNDGIKLSDCAVMYRTNFQSRVLEEAFRRYNMPYKLVAGTSFYERKEIKDLVAYFRVIANPRDDISLLRIINTPARGIGDKTIEDVARHAGELHLSLYGSIEDIVSPQNITPLFSQRTVKSLKGFFDKIEHMRELSKELNLSNLYDYIVETVGFKESFENLPDGDDRWGNIMEFRNVAEQYDVLDKTEQLQAMLEGVSLVSDVDGLDESEQGVTLITLHQAKGLEFPVVFLVGMEEGLLPHRRSFDDPSGMEEERRLCYVGITRAMKKLFFTRALRRMMMGNPLMNPPSRFLEDIPAEDIASDAAPFSVKRTRVRDIAEVEENVPDEPTDLITFKPGDHVYHKVFGSGTVISYNPVRNDAEVLVQFKGPGLKKLKQSLAHLTPE